MPLVGHAARRAAGGTPGHAPAVDSGLPHAARGGVGTERATVTLPVVRQAEEPERRAMSRVRRKLVRSPLALAGALVLAVVIGAAVAAPYVAPHDPAKQSLLRRFTPPVWAADGNAAYPLGTDQVGRDILSRIIHGARVSLLVGVSAVAVSLVVGVMLGLVSGFVGGRTDTVIMTVVDITLSFPQLLLALAFVAALGPSLVTIIVVLGLTGWERYARVVRAEVLAVREKDFIEAARAIGVPGSRILFRHVLPSTFSSIIVMSTLQVAQAILQEAALSFLGVGTGNAYPTWGQMIALGRDFVSVAWWLPTFPGLAILVTVLAINLVGDRLRDALDPRVG
jgi:peptide/nickel transport system permease protein